MAEQAEAVVCGPVILSLLRRSWERIYAERCPLIFIYLPYDGCVCIDTYTHTHKEGGGRERKREIEIKDNEVMNLKRNKVRVYVRDFGGRKGNRGNDI